MGGMGGIGKTGGVLVNTHHHALEKTTDKGLREHMKGWKVPQGEDQGRTRALFELLESAKKKEREGMEGPTRGRCLEYGKSHRGRNQRGIFSALPAGGRQMCSVCGALLVAC